MRSSNWFNNAFGFNEETYNITQKKLIELTKDNKINGILYGQLKIIDLNELYKVLPSGIIQGKVIFKNIVGDIKEIHQDNNIENATIQVASQLNCLEMINPRITPKHGITIYERDRTQGPISVICTPAGIAYRNYMLDKNIDLSENLLTFFKNYDLTIDWKVINGYLFTNEESLVKINKLLTNKSIRSEAKKKLLVGMHNNLGVFIDNKLYDYTVNHVLCSGLPISYQNIDIEMWNGLSELFLDFYYEITLLIACYNNLKNKSNKPCYLTQIGGGTFGMKKEYIINAVIKACNEIKKIGYNLEVIMVHYRNIDSDYNIIETII